MTLLFGLGMVLAVEGLVLALIPGRIEEAMALFARLTTDQRRGIGLAALALGVVIIALARSRLG